MRLNFVVEALRHVPKQPKQFVLVAPFTLLSRRRVGSFLHLNATKLDAHENKSSWVENKFGCNRK